MEVIRDNQKIKIITYLESKEDATIFKHFKGQEYKIVAVAIHSETKEKYVVYRWLYWNNEVYIRPLDMFLSEVDHEKYQNVTQKYRFELQEIESLNK